MCTSCSIYILDLSVFAKDHGFPVCDLDKAVTVNPDNGVVYLEDTDIKRKVSHKFGTHSAPWYMYKVRNPQHTQLTKCTTGCGSTHISSVCYCVQAIQSSNCLTDDLESASVIFVYDYCYYIWWLAHVHSLGRERRDTPGDYLVKASRFSCQAPVPS